MQDLSSTGELVTLGLVDSSVGTNSKLGVFLLEDCHILKAKSAILLTLSHRGCNIKRKGGSAVHWKHYSINLKLQGLQE